MISCTTTQNSEAVLRQFLETPDGADSQRHLERLMKEYAGPVIGSVLRRMWRVSPPLARGRWETPEESEAQDARSEAVTQLLLRLRAAKADPATEPIDDFAAYVAVTAYRACHKVLRQKYPMRGRLKNRIRQAILRQSPHFALWQERPRVWVAGRAAWRNERPLQRNDERLQQLRRSPETAAVTLRTFATGESGTLAQLVPELLDLAGGPVELDELTGTIADICDLKDLTCTRDSDTGSDADSGRNGIAEAADPRTSVDEAVGERVFLGELWQEVLLLPRGQRAALLLNLRDEQGRGILALLPMLGIATVREIAGALEMTPEALAAIWNDLPLADTAIAERMGATRQQVINLRSIARKRLARRAARGEKS